MEPTDVWLRAARAGKNKDVPDGKTFKKSDGGGLFILIKPNGKMYWRVAYRFAGKQKTLAIGPYPLVGLAAARDARDNARRCF